MARQYSVTYNHSVLETSLTEFYKRYSAAEVHTTIGPSIRTAGTLYEIDGKGAIYDLRGKNEVHIFLIGFNERSSFYKQLNKELVDILSNSGLTKVTTRRYYPQPALLDDKT